MKSAAIDIYYVLISLLLLSLDGVSIYYNIFIEHRGLRSNILLTLNIVVLLCFLTSYVFLFLKKKIYRVIISVPFTCYMFYITVATSFFYIIAIYGLLLSILLFYLTKTKITTKMLYSIICAVIYITIMLLQATGVIPLEQSDIEINSYTSLGVVVIAIALIAGLVVNSYLIYMNRIKKVISIRAVSKSKKNDEEQEKEDKKLTDVNSLSSHSDS